MVPWSVQSLFFININHKNSATFGKHPTSTNRGTQEKVFAPGRGHTRRARNPDTPPMIGPIDGTFSSRRTYRLHTTHQLKINTQRNKPMSGTVNTHLIIIIFVSI